MTHHATANGDEGEGIIAIDSEDAEGLFAALSSATAREILVVLYEESMTSSQLSNTVDTSLQNVNHHLDQLQDAGLVEVAGTATSEQGREMNEYGPTTDALVLHAGDGRESTDGAGGERRDRRARGDDHADDGTDDRAVDDRWDSGPDVVDGERGVTGSPARTFLLGALVAVAAVALLRVLRRN